MTTPEIQKSGQKGLENYQKKLGGIIPSQLKNGDIIIIETSAYIYEMRVIINQFPTPRFHIQTACKMCNSCGSLVTAIIGHENKLKLNIEDWIGRGLCLILKFTTGSNFLTGIVTGATLVSKRKDGSEFSYDMWRDK